MLKYYAERAENNGGLLVVEATAPTSRLGLYANTPILENDKQVEGWRHVVESVHDNGSFISIQLCGLGRTADAALLRKHNLPLVAPSPIYINENFTPHTTQSREADEAAHNPLRALTVDEIHSFVEDYAAAARRAIEGAKFDIVEIHGAHGYLVEQFLSSAANHRTDEYGGSIENRARFGLEGVDALIAAVGAEHVTIRLSPYATFQATEGVNADISPIVSYGYVLSELERRAKAGKRLAYVSFVEPRVSGADDVVDPPKVNTSWVNEIWKGVLLRTGGFLHDEGYPDLRKYVDADDRTLIGVSRYYTSSPDLANRLRNGYPLTHYDKPTFYVPKSNKGYLTFAKYGEKALDDDSPEIKAEPRPLA
ncbi:DEKNAAC103196 [Brettanomyces naardenensis]|uniref:DEKNAAC103196 n=1 Tax=Brettanomyces naardenensis TaxID=13370 RepID=A0A448YML8_BRENA|nr:DEKNAAC103196 [Brettanomyces naardenensis]